MGYGHKQCNVVNTIYNSMKLRGKSLCNRPKLLDRYEKIVCEWRLGGVCVGCGLVEGYIAILLPENQVPGYPFYYPTGTRVQKYPKVRALVLIFCLQLAAVPAPAVRRPVRRTVGRLATANFYCAF